MGADVARFFSIILVAAISGCATAGPPPAPPPPPAPIVSYDGHYRGTIRLTSTSRVVSGAGSNWCKTPPAISLSVQNNEFTFVLAHPNLPRDGGDSLSPTFVVPISPNGAFRAFNRNGTSEITGLITESHMAGRIRGAGCSYAFTAERS